MYTTRCVEFFIELYQYILRQYPKKRNRCPLRFPGCFAGRKHAQLAPKAGPKIRPANRRKNFFLPKGLGKNYFGCLDTFCRPKWVSHTISCPAKTASFSTKVVHSHAKRSCQDGDLERRGGVSTTEKSNRRSNKYASKERLLQSHFSSPEEDRRMATSDRPVSSESVCSLSSFQNGDIEFNQVSTSERRFGNESGSPRCIFSYRHSPSITSLSSFVFEGKVYQFRALAFGLNVSPYVFTQMLKTVLRHVRRLGIRVHAYLDDWLQPSVSETLSWLHSRGLLKIILDLGFIPNWEKSELVPVQDFCFLGARFKLAQALIGPSQDNIASILQALAKLVGARQASARQLYSILGQMESMASLLPLGRAFKRSLQWELKERWCQRLALWDTNILLGQWFVSAVAPWMDLDFLTSMSPLHHPSPQLHLFTDLSLEGWGAHMDNHMASGFWSIIYKKQHINVLEMKAVLLALQAFAVHIKGHSVLLATDNTTVAAYINKQGGTHSRTLCNLAVEAAEWCARNKVHLKARYLPGRLNALADCLSRKGAVVQTEWSLNQRVASQIFHVWGSPHIDLFATHLNRKLPLFVSPVLEPEAYATDALSLSWVGMWAYAFPPFPLILTCLRKIQIEECLVCLVAPLWEGQAWFPLLLSLLVAPAICLPWKEDLLYQSISRMLHPFRLHAWLLCNNACKRQAFLNQLPD